MSRFGLTGLQSFKRHRNALSIRKGVLYHCGGDGLLTFVVNFSILVEVMLVVHYQMTHIGREKSLNLMRQQVWNLRLSSVAGDATLSCALCQHMKVFHDSSSNA